ncbi:MAG: TlpA family protein disulfide reductase [Thermoflavifilum sp.]|nr:TlpA family protein disulfide reductase [Thermoflavifilum sp.]MCL6514709.1 TlpA family protein disulfide reductase [Alicyclobacillus sp.]
MRRGWLLTGLGVLLVLALVIAFRTLHQPSARPFAGNPAPNFTLHTVEGGSAVSLSALRGKPVVLNFWASWCGPCNEEQPLLNQAATQYGGQVQFIGVNVTVGDNVSHVQAFIRQHSVTYPVLLDPRGTVSTLYQVSALPTTLFIDSSGRIVDRVTGALTQTALDQEMKRLTASSTAAG